jgi:hypothetical protein
MLAETFNMRLPVSGATREVPQHPGGTRFATERRRTMRL